jgi:valyl-tRNA synthetase
MVKPVLLDKHGTESDKQNTKRVLLETLDRSLRLLHPFMPFITEEIWQKLGGLEPSIMVSPYPIAEEVLEDNEAERLVAAVKAITSAVRNVRAERGFTPKDRFKLFINTENTRDANFFGEYGYLLTELARLTELVVNGNPPADAHHDVIEGFAIAIEIPEKRVSEEQIQRTQREIEKSRKELASLEAKLANTQFVQNAPAAVVEQAQARHLELRARIEKLMQNQCCYIFT